MSLILERDINTLSPRFVTSLVLGRPYSSIGSAFGFWLARYLWRVQVRIPLATLAKISIIEKYPIVPEVICI